MKPKTGAELIAEERARQIAAEDWTPQHDDKYKKQELPVAAQCLLDHFLGRNWVFADDPDNYRNEEVPRDWPWAKRRWKPKNPDRDLVIVGALIAAEIDRRNRAIAKATYAQ